MARAAIPRRRLFLAAAVVSFALANAAQAAEGGGGNKNGLYFRAHGGLAHQAKSSINGTNVTSGNLDLGSAPSLSGAFGYRWANLRLEGFAAWRRHGADSFGAAKLVAADLDTGATATLTGVGGFKVPVSGDATTITALVNGIVDIDFNLPVVPFLGAGLGVAHVSVNDVRGSFGGVRFRLTDDTDMVLAYQALGGLAFPITDEITVEAQYRYQTMTDPEFTDSLGGSFDLENDSHNFEVGLRLNF